MSEAAVRWCSSKLSVLKNFAICVGVFNPEWPWPISGQCSYSITPENIKNFIFLIFSGVTWFFIKSSYETSTLFLCNMRSLLVFAISVMDVSIFILFWLEPDVSLLNLVSLAVAWHTKRYRSLMNSVKMILERNGVIRKKCSRVSWNLIFCLSRSIEEKHHGVAIAFINSFMTDVLIALQINGLVFCDRAISQERV